jgi:3D (Asp-Asp-Asp) domain-containing protein
MYLNIIAPPEPIIEPVETVMVELTAYCPCSKCCGWNTGITKSGTIATEGRTVAADVNLYPFGTQVEIDGIVYTVEDTGGAIRGNRMDIFYNSHSDALKFGRQTKTVIIK